jgi:hypothetical protein
MLRQRFGESSFASYVGDSEILSRGLGEMLDSSECSAFGKAAMESIGVSILSRNFCPLLFPSLGSHFATFLDHLMKRYERQQWH